MMKRSTVPGLLVLAALSVSCAQTGQDIKPVVPVVGQILADHNDARFKLLAVDSKPERDGAIFIVGQEKDCDIYSEELSTCDYRDNVDGTYKTDGLPDFCGEKICTIADIAGGDYSCYLATGIEDSLSTRAVQLGLLALDTMCFVSPYDLEGLVSQPRAKVLVLASSYLCQYGLYDLDSLFRGTNCEVSLLNPLAEMKKQAFDRNPGNIGVLAPAGLLSAGLYKDCVAFPVESGRNDALLSFLDDYSAAGYSEPLKALIVDDLSIDCERLESTLAKIRSVMNEESLLYSHLLSPEFRILNPKKIISASCVDILRKKNLFTHYILKPRVDKYMTVNRAETVLIPYNERYL